jgi:hypothetical protein
MGGAYDIRRERSRNDPVAAANGACQHGPNRGRPERGAAFLDPAAARDDRRPTAAGFRITVISEPAVAPDTPSDLLPADIADGRRFLWFLFFVLHAS